ncbi:MAG TPA: hypothetical protein VHZ28_06190 [Terracidiphilus sp.]|nr:hypothetical protein [Terracidiphilus sp.]
MKQEWVEAQLELKRRTKTLTKIWLRLIACGLIRRNSKRYGELIDEVRLISSKEQQRIWELDHPRKKRGDSSAKRRGIV